MMNRREWGQWCAAAALAGNCAAVHAAAAPALVGNAQHLVVAVANKAAFCYLPLTIAERLGFFEAEGVY